MLSLVPGSMLAVFFDHIMPHLSLNGFLYIFAAGMIIYLLLAHVLTVLFGNDEKQSGFTA
jgi:hypothetical protein